MSGRCQFAAKHRKTPQNDAKRCKTPQNATTHRNTPQNAAKHRNYPKLAISLRGTRYLGGLKNAPFSDQLKLIVDQNWGALAPFPPPKTFCFVSSCTLVEKRQKMSAQRI